MQISPEISGYLTPEEKEKLLKLSDFSKHHWTPSAWACELVMKACADKKISSETLANGILQVPICPTELWKSVRL